MEMRQSREVNSAVNTTMDSDNGRLLRVVLADDHSVVREGMKALINAQPDMEVVGETIDGEECWRLIRAFATRSALPDIVTMDISMPGWSGIETITRILKSWPTMKVVVLSMHEERSYLRSVLEAGAVGYILKRSASTELIRAIRAVAGGSVYLDQALTASMMGSFLRGKQRERGASAAGLRGEIAGITLSEREESVLRLIAQGFTNKEIGVRLKLSVKTVETYKARSMEKLSLGSRTDIMQYALSQDWLK